MSICGGVIYFPSLPSNNPQSAVPESSRRPRFVPRKQFGFPCPADLSTVPEPWIMTRFSCIRRCTNFRLWTAVGIKTFVSIKCLPSVAYVRVCFGLPTLYRIPYFRLNALLQQQNKQKPLCCTITQIRIITLRNSMPEFVENNRFPLFDKIFVQSLGKVRTRPISSSSIFLLHFIQFQYPTCTTKYFPVELFTNILQTYLLPMEKHKTKKRWRLLSEYLFLKVNVSKINIRTYSSKRSSKLD